MMDEQRLRDIFAKKLLRQSSRSDNVAYAESVRTGHDNTWGGAAAIEAMHQVRDETSSEPWLGNATNEQLIAELRTRIEIHFPGGLNYKTAGVD